MDEQAAEPPQVNMADEDTPMPEEVSSESGSGSESEEEQTEWLVTTREKRSTAGNRLTSLLQQEEPDDELELLFAEDEEDEGFEDEEVQSDVQMDSSDDDDDQGPAAGAEDLEGEKELQKQARAEKLAKKKKHGDGIPKIFKKRVKIDPTASQAPPPRPKKKSERASWLPTAEEAPTRASQRGTTRQSKQQLHAQMIDREIKRLKQLESMEKAAAKKEAAKKPAKTQADRLAEAARVEKQNSKSLSRWEEAEQQREEEQLAKLAALSNRHLEGPVITWWSGMAEWVGGTLKKVGKTLELEDPKEKLTRKRKAAEMEADSAATPAPSGDQVMTDAPASTTTPDLPPNSTKDNATPQSANLPPANPGSTTTQASTPLLAPPVQPNNVSPNNQASVPQASTPLPVQPQSNQAPTPLLAPPAPPQPPPTNQHPSALPPSTNLAPPRPLLAPPQQWHPLALDGSSPLPGFGPPHLPRLMPSQPFGPINPNQLNQPPPPPPPPAPPAIEHAARNYVILSNFDEDAVKDKHVQTTILMGRKFVKMASTYPSPTPIPYLTFPENKRDHDLCAITSYPAKFRDPSTGLPYCNAYAYKEIQKLKRGEFRWSKLVGAYVGLANYAARGVPPRFLNPKAAKVPPPLGAMGPPPTPTPKPAP